MMYGHKLRGQQQVPNPIAGVGPNCDRPLRHTFASAWQSSDWCFRQIPYKAKWRPNPCRKSESAAYPSGSIVSCLTMRHSRAIKARPFVRPLPCTQIDSPCVAS